MALDIFARIANKTSLVFSNKTKDAATVIIADMSRQMGQDFVAEARIYPPENEGNRPPPPYWVRGSGLVRASGEVNPTSQNYGESWKTAVARTPFGGRASVTNTTTYSPYLSDEVRQAGFHAERGWRTITAIANAVGMELQREAEGRYSVAQAPSYVERSVNKISSFMQGLFNR